MMTDIVKRLRDLAELLSPENTDSEAGLHAICEEAAAEIERLRNVAQTAATRIDDHMIRARRLVEDHIEAYGMVPHPDRIKEAIAEQSQKSFDLGFRAAGGSILAIPSAQCGGPIPSAPGASAPARRPPE